MDAEQQPEVKRLKFTVAYDGAPWHGWQTLPAGHTVQDQLEAALEKIAGVPVRTHGSGRTDSGVHALGQVAHGDVPASAKLSGADWTRALNAVLPSSIRVMKSEFVAADFHARYDAKGKIYRYRIWRPNVMSPFEVGRAWHVYGALDVDAVRESVRVLAGTHNFSRLSANRGGITEEERCRNAKDVTRTLTRVEVREQEGTLEIEVEGDGFLYKMVRLIVGSLIHVARGRADVAWFHSLVEDPTGPKSHRVAPADGLCLVAVKY